MPASGHTPVPCPHCGTDLAVAGRPLDLWGLAIYMEAEARSLGLDAQDNAVLLRLYWKAVDEGLPALPPGADRHPERTYTFQCPECGEWETDAATVAATVAAAVAASDQYVERLTAALLGHYDATS